MGELEARSRGGADGAIVRAERGIAARDHCVSSRRNDLDALRGALLVLMTLTHLPTRLRSYSDQPLGFVSAAEGFVFLSAFVVGKTYSLSLVERGADYVRQRLWSRALKVYGHHIGLLGFAFTIVAVLAAVGSRPSLLHLLAFYFDSPGLALVGGPLLLYQPPLLDILPMYIVFLLLSPFLLERLSTGWHCRLLACSVLVWLFSQLGGRAALLGLFCFVSGLSLPIEAIGSFDLLAWQLLWVVGLWAGMDASRERAWRPSRPMLAAALLVSLAFFAWRHQLAGWSPELGASWLDKWHLGALRLLNFGALALLVSRGVLPLLRWLGVSALALLGRASLQVFTAHVLLCLLSLGLVVDDETPLSSLEELSVLLVTLAAMLLVAWRSGAPEVRRYGYS